MAITALPACVLPVCAYTAEQPVHTEKATSIPPAAIKNSVRRPDLSTSATEKPMATKKDQICNPPSTSDWLEGFVTPTEFRMSCK